jgi:hypothetical protein
MASVLDLPLDQFHGYLAESAQYGMKPAQRDDLLRQYRLQNSAEGALSGLLAPEDGKRRSAFFPVDAPQGMSIWDALTSGKASPAIPQGLIDLITGSARAVETPRAAAQGLIPDADIDMAALETAGLAMAGGGVVAGRDAFTYDPNTTNIFAGRSADFTSHPPDKNPGMASIDDANKMLSEGRTNREIFDATGWFQGADGKLRFEIDDKNAKLTLPPTLRNFLTDGESKTFPLKDILNHPEYYRAYPGAGSQQINLSKPDEFTGVQGSYSPATNQINARIDRPDDDVLSTILHEVQHGVQMREGFSGGSNPEFAQTQAQEFSNVIMSSPDVRDLYDNSSKFSRINMQLGPLYRADYIDGLDNLIEKARDGRAKPRDITGTQDWYRYSSEIINSQGRMPRKKGPDRDQWIAQAASYIKRQALNEDQTTGWLKIAYQDFPTVKDRKNAIRRLERQAGKVRGDAFKYSKIANRVNDLRELNAGAAYRREAGETEARNVQTRLELGREGDKISPAEDGVFPGDTQDFPFLDQIVSNLRRGQSVPGLLSNKLNRRGLLD